MSELKFFLEYFNTIFDLLNLYKNLVDKLIKVQEKEPENYEKMKNAAVNPQFLFEMVYKLENKDVSTKLFKILGDVKEIEAKLHSLYFSDVEEKKRLKEKLEDVTNELKELREELKKIEGIKND